MARRSPELVRECDTKTAICEASFTPRKINEEPSVVEEVFIYRRPEDGKYLSKSVYTTTYRFSERLFKRKKNEVAWAWLVYDSMEDLRQNLWQAFSIATEINNVVVQLGGRPGTNFMGWQRGYVPPKSSRSETLAERAARERREAEAEARRTLQAEVARQQPADRGQGVGSLQIRPATQK